MFQENLVPTFLEAIYKLIRMGHKSISALVFGFNNLKCVILMSHASGPLILM